MSKTAKGLSAALIICVLAVVGGLFACKPLVEQAVRDALRNVNPDATICSIDTVDINPLSFTLKLGNIRISDQRTYDTVLKEATMTLSPRFVLACVPFLRDSILPAAGDAPLFSSATGRKSFMNRKEIYLRKRKMRPSPPALWPWTPLCSSVC